jgi:hypothetical protein
VNEKDTNRKQSKDHTVVSKNDIGACITRSSASYMPECKTRR